MGDGRDIAVKKLSQRSNQGKKEFLNEAKLLSRVQHKNVVNLVGYCVHDTENLLVYEYVVNQSLDKLLFSKFFVFALFPLCVHLLIRVVPFLFSAFCFLLSVSECCMLQFWIQSTNNLGRASLFRR